MNKFDRHENLLKRHTLLNVMQIRAFTQCADKYMCDYRTARVDRNLIGRPVL